MQRGGTLPDWGVESGRARRSGDFVQTTLLIGVLVALSFVLTLFVAPSVGLIPVLIALVVLVGAAFWWVNIQGLLALRSIGAVRVTPEEEPRLGNISSGLAADIGVPAPKLFVTPDEDSNALICIARGPALAVTRGLLDSYTRTELEAVVAHSLARLALGSIERTTVAVALGPFGSKRAPFVGQNDDIQAAAITRYPPALASAVEKATARGGRFASFWFVGDEPTHRPQQQRADSIRDL